MEPSGGDEGTTSPLFLYSSINIAIGCHRTGLAGTLTSSDWLAVSCYVTSFVMSLESLTEQSRYQPYALRLVSLQNQGPNLALLHINE